MKIWDIYKLAIEMGVAADPRGQKAIQSHLQTQQENYDALSEEQRANFDTELLTNPFPDTRLLFGRPEQEVKHLFMGIDIGVSELLLVDRLNQKGAGIDVVIAHHPEGIALTTLHQAMDLQADVFACCGVPVNVAEHLLAGEAAKTALSIVVGNYNRVVDAARLLDLPFLSVHTPTDNLVQHYFEEKFRELQPKTLGNIMQILEAEPEYQEAQKSEAGPEILFGSPHNRVGKIMVDMTGGTDAGPEIYSKLQAAGVGTVVAMHLGPEVKESLEKSQINIILAGHMSSDSLGINLFLDQLEARGVQITPGSGFMRFSRLASTPAL